MYYTQEQIDRANQADLVSFLQSQGEQLTRAGNEYRWKRHDSMTIRGNKWYRHSQSKGGGPVDFVMEFFGKSFTEAVELLTGEQGAAAPDRPSPAPLSDFRLPPRSDTAGQVKSYLTAARRIDEDVTGFFLSSGDIYEEAAHHNAVFVGRDESGIPRYAHQCGTAGNFRLDVKGSDKAFNFSYRGAGERLFVFEAPIDLLSFLCLFKKGWQKQSYLSLGGVGEKALLRFLSDRPDIQTVYLCLDSDQAGNDACSRLVELMPEGLTVHRLIPLFKDWNEVQTRRGEITDGKYLREAVYGLKEPPQEETVEIIRMSEVDTQTVEWLWEPYIPIGKVTIVQGKSRIDEMLAFAEKAEREYMAEAAGYVQTPADIAEQAQAVPRDTFSIYQLKSGNETLDYRFEPLDAIRSNGLSVKPENYELVYTAPLTEQDSLESIYTRFNIDHPADFKGHSLSVSDIVVLHQDGKDTAHYCDRFGFSQVPEFLQPERAVEVTIPTPDQMATQERISTPRGSFCVTNMTKEQMEAAGYGIHHQSDDGKYLIMGNGTRAFAVLAQQPEQDNPLRTAEMTLEDDYGMIDGVINNGRRGEELEKAQEYAERTTPEKPSIHERLEDAKRECAEHKPPEGKKPGRDVPEHDCL